MKAPVNHTLHRWPISREAVGKEGLRESVAKRHTERKVWKEEEEEVRERQMKKMTERKRAREEGLQLQSCHVRSVSDLILSFFVRVHELQSLQVR